jgi:hypothetical protein
VKGKFGFIYRSQNLTQPILNSFFKTKFPFPQPPFGLKKCEVDNKKYACVGNRVQLKKRKKERRCEIGHEALTTTT